MDDPSALKIDVIAAVVRRDGKFLACQRPPEKRHGNLWEFPGGKLEPGETLLAAAQRELDEELTLRVIEIGEIRFKSQDPGSNFVVNFVDVVADGVPEAIEHTRVDWFTANELLALQLAPSDRQFAEFLVRDNLYG
ncbi:MAG: 8-oxo-dGTP diphosphatase MutT [Candidatus Melainabacteria bacterium]|nr:MAG: 8-oxo-dGTP diphosphatase MutT [Candidatus Melainabacteria bacterium]